jgi:hypothetical protein
LSRGCELRSRFPAEHASARSFPTNSGSDSHEISCVDSKRLSAGKIAG